MWRNVQRNNKTSEKNNTENCLTHTPTNTKSRTKETVKSGILKNQLVDINHHHHRGHPVTSPSECSKMTKKLKSKKTSPSSSPSSPSLTSPSSIVEKILMSKSDETTFNMKWQAQRSLVIASIVVCVFALMLGTALSKEPPDKVLTPTVFSEWTKTTEYKSDSSISAHGMKPVYMIAHKIIMFFVGDDPLPDGYIVLTNKTFTLGEKVDHNDWGDLIKSYWGIMLIVIVILLLAVLFPIIGICFCFCRCAGLCGSRTQPFDKKYDTCRRVILGLLLLILTVLLLFGVIAVFTTNVYLQAGINSSTRSVRTSAADVRLFLTVTGQQTDLVLVKNYQELYDNMDKLLGDYSVYIMDELEEKSMASSLKHLSELLAQLPELRTELTKIKKLTNDLRIYASQLSDGLRGVKREILSKVLHCENKEPIKKLMNKYEISLIDNTTIHYDAMVDRYYPKLPDVTEVVAQMDKLIEEKIVSAGDRGIHAFETIRKELSTAVGRYAPEILGALKDAGKGFTKASGEINNELDRLSNSIQNDGQEVAERADEYLGKFGPYRFYSGIIVSAALLLILCCLVAALCCGICGKRRGGYGDDCCNKGSGARFLMIAVCLIFLTGSIIAIVGLIHFMFGVVTYRGVCIPLIKRDEDKLFKSYDKSIDLNEVINKKLGRSRLGGRDAKPLRLSSVIAACKSNETIYEVLKIRDHFDIREIRDYPNQYKINQNLDKLVNELSFNENFQIFSDEDKRRIRTFSESELANFDPSKYEENLNDQITKYSLPQVANDLQKLGQELNIDDNLVCKDAVSVLRNQALHLRAYEQNLVEPMQTSSKQLIEMALKLKKALTYKDKPFKESIDTLMFEVDKMQQFINTQGVPYVKSVAQNLTKFLSGEIDRYLNRVISKVENEIGQCSPLANVYDSGVSAACNRVIEPMNGFWLAVLFCILLFIPILFIAIKLSKLYKKSDPYPGPLVEAEYLYDAYSERDHIPMSNGPKNKRRKNKDRRRGRGGGSGGGAVGGAGVEYYDETVVATSHGVPPQVAAAGVRDTRYNDMAPKHWDGGPPRYQNPPIAPPASEYERPPPYYYPGATEQD